MLSFQMTGEAAMEFFRRVSLLDKEEDCEEARTKILIKMAQEGLIDSVLETGRSKEQYVADLKRNFSVLDVSEKINEDR